MSPYIDGESQSPTDGKEEDIRQDEAELNHTYIMLVDMHPFDPEGCASDEEIEKRIKANPIPPIGSPYTSHLSASAVDLIKKLMEPDPNKRLTAAAMLEHPWVMGETVNKWKMVGSDAKVAKFKEM